MMGAFVWAKMLLAVFWDEFILKFFADIGVRWGGFTIYDRQRGGCGDNYLVILCVFKF